MSTLEDDVMVKRKSKQVNETTHHETHTSFIESLNLDETAKLLTTLKTIIFSTPDESNRSKIQMLKDEILAGNYQISSQHIAAKLSEYVRVVSEDCEMA